MRCVRGLEHRRIASAHRRSRRPAALTIRPCGPGGRRCARSRSLTAIFGWLRAARSSVGPSVDGSASGTGSRSSGVGRPVWRRIIALRPAFVQKLHRQIHQRRAAVGDDKPPIVGELADHGRLTSSPRTAPETRRARRRRHGQHHALLRLGEPDLPGLQAAIFERHIVQLHLHAGSLAHLAHGRGKPARAAVGDRAVQPPVARLEQHVDHLFLGDRVADLHRAADRLGGLVGQLGRREGRAVDAVAAGAPAEHHHRIAGLAPGRVLAARRKARPCRRTPAGCAV